MKPTAAAGEVTAPEAGARTPSLARELLLAVPKGRGKFWLAALFAVLASSSSVALMGVSAFLISFAAMSPPVLYLQVPAVLVRTFGITRGAARYMERITGHDLVLRMQSVLRLRIYDKLAGTTLIGSRRGDLLTRVVSDVKAIQDLVVRVILPVLSAGIVVLGATFAFWLISPAAAFWLLVTSIVGGVLVPWWAQRASVRIDRAAVPTRGRLSNEVREFTRTVPDLVAYGAVDRALADIDATDAELTRQEARGSWVRGVAGAGQVIAAGGAVLASLIVGAPAVVAGSMDPRMLAVLTLMPLALHEVFGTFAQAAQTHTRARVALRRVSETLEAPSVGAGDVTPGDPGVSGLELDAVSVGWPGGPVVQSDLNLDVRPGEKVALVGPSGVGKTTVAATAMGLIPPLAGTIRRGGQVGYLAQDAHIFSTTVAENVRVGNKDATDEEVVTALRRAGLDLDPQRLVGEDGYNLSGGERRRLSFARVLAAPRDLFILDEPTEHLDRETAENLIDDMLSATSSDAVLIITHDAGLIARCDRSVVLAGA